MAETGIGSVYGNGYESRYASSTKEEAIEKQEAERTAGKNDTNAQEYYDYLKSKYECLSSRDYKVTISPVFLEKCIKDPEKAELLEKNLANIPVSYRHFTAAWNALGAKLVNQEFIFDENGNCGGSPNTYVTNNRSSFDSGTWDKRLEKKGQEQKMSPQKHYEKRKLLREQFDEKLAEKEYLKDQLAEERMEEDLLKKSIASKERNAGRFVERYEANILS